MEATCCHNPEDHDSNLLCSEVLSLAFWNVNLKISGSYWCTSSVWITHSVLHKESLYWKLPILCCIWWGHLFILPPRITILPVPGNFNVSVKEYCLQLVFLCTFLPVAAPFKLITSWCFHTISLKIPSQKMFQYLYIMCKRGHITLPHCTENV